MVLESDCFVVAEKSAGLKFAIVGGGTRGKLYSDWLLANEGAGSVVAIAEPRADARSAIARPHGIPEDKQFSSWRELLDAPRLADVLINATMDQEHAESSVQALALGYHMLLEKPSATSIADAKRIDAARLSADRIVSVCHSLRYHVVYEHVLDLVRSGAIGDVVSIDQLEAVEHVHQSHSFVRGNWGNESRSTFMLLAKSCHDIDIIASIAPGNCLRVGSFGSLSYFNPRNAPEGSPLYCVDGCPVQDRCPYYAPKIYTPENFWKRHGGMAGLSAEETRLRLRESPYGLCVFKTDNDVVDHQVVMMEFEGGVTATFTMTGFTPWGGRYLRVHGTKGYIEAKSDQRTVDMWEFWADNRHTHVDFPADSGAHGGGDGRLIRNFVESVRSGNGASVRTGTGESLRTHSIVFAAEHARRSGSVVELSTFVDLS